MASPPRPPGLPQAVIDNTLLARLVHLDVAKFLPLIFNRILIPPEVKREAYKAPHKGKRRLRKLLNEMAGFFVICTAVDRSIQLILEADLDVGEASAIAQAESTRSVVLIDEKKGYERARRMELEAIRTARILLMLLDAGAISAVKPYFEKLEATGFYLGENVRLALLAEAGEE